jgi:glycosyltransferase involved in cell wall biosynthesis
VVTVSQAVKDEIVEVFSLSPDRVRVVPNVVPRLFAQMLHDPERVQEVMREHGIRKPYALFVGTLEARKNVVTLLKAFSIVHARESDIRLVLVGRPGFGFEEIQKTMQSLPHATSKDVVFTGSVPDEQLVHLYDGAEFLVLPSLYEGFGIPLVEAMARGIPLVVSDIPSSREVAGEAALYYGIDPRDHEALAEAMWRLLREESLKQKLLTRGTERIKMFSWNAVREKLIATYMQVCGRDR